MVSKILATLFAVAVVTVGGISYSHYANDTCGHRCPLSGALTPPASDDTPISTSVPDCCQSPTRASCCSTESDSVTILTSEVLTVQPREVE